MENWFYCNSPVGGYHVAKNARATVAHLSRHVQKFIAITSKQFRWEQNEISIEFELRWKNPSWNGLLGQFDCYSRLLFETTHADPVDVHLYSGTRGLWADNINLEKIHAALVQNSDLINPQFCTKLSNWSTNSLSESKVKQKEHPKSISYKLISSLWKGSQTTSNVLVLLRVYLNNITSQIHQAPLCVLLCTKYCVTTQN